jgi:nicotinate phosphoribosyltransferase
MLDDAGYSDVKIIVSNSLDEHIITHVLSQGAKIDSFGVGERLITAKSEPVFGGVYKLVAIEDGDSLIPKIKISENEEKITNPGFKKIYRIFDKNSNKAMADLICLHDEVIDESKPLEIFNPIHTWKKKILTNYYVKDLMVQVFRKGEPCYETPSVREIQLFAKQETEKLWEEVLRFENPHAYYIDLSKDLWDLKHNLLNKYSDLYK